MYTIKVYKGFVFLSITFYEYLKFMKMVVLLYIYKYWLLLYYRRYV